MLSLTTLRHLWCALVVLSAPALLAAACGGSPSNGNQANQNSEVQALKWTQCMQQHGVKAKATSNGHGSSVGVPAPGQPGGPSQQQLQAAQQACNHYQPNGGQGAGPPSSRQLAQNEKYVQCLNQHGVPAKAQGGGVEVNVPQDMDPNKAQQAEDACQKYQPQH
jgi:hypothetical protein